LVELVGGWGFFLGLIRTLIRNGFGVSCHFSLPGLQALVPGWDEDVYVLGALQSLEGDEDHFYFGCLVLHVLVVVVFWRLSWSLILVLHSLAVCTRLAEADPTARGCRGSR
jgi:hypothetical protein